MKLNETIQAITNILVDNDLDTYECFKVFNGLMVYYIQISGDGITLETCEEDNKPLDDEKTATEIYDYLRVEFNKVHLYELDEEQIKRLCKRICFGSIFYADYNNQFGVDCHEVSHYADGFIEDIEQRCEFEEYLDSTSPNEFAHDFHEYIQYAEYYNV